MRGKKLFTVTVLSALAAHAQTTNFSLEFGGPAEMHGNGEPTSFRGSQGNPSFYGYDLTDSIIHITNFNFEGGAAADSHKTSDIAYANGGHGASLSATDGLRNGPLGFAWPADLPGPITPITPIDPIGPGSGSGSSGSGTVIIVNPGIGSGSSSSGSLIISNPIDIGTQGGSGGNVLISGGTLAGEGILIGGEAGTINISGGTFTGGSAGNAVAVGGQGLRLTNDISIISGGMFTGGNGGIFTGGNSGSALTLTNSGTFGASLTIAPGTTITTPTFTIHPRTTPFDSIEYDFELIDSTFVGGHAGEALSDSKYAMAHGGAGMHLETGQRVHFENNHATGGNGGEATGQYFVTASGGNGLQLYGATNALLNGGSFTGGNGGMATVSNTEDFWSYNESSRADGGTGLWIEGGDASHSLELRNVTAQGGQGGTAAGNWNLYADGGHGAVVQNYSNVVIQGGSYIGGDEGEEINLRYGDRPRSSAGFYYYNSYGSAGSGMVLEAGHAEIMGGIFKGGGSEWRSGTGLTFRGDRLDIYDGEFSGGDLYSSGSGLSAQAEKEINLLGGRFSHIYLQGTYEDDQFTDLYLSRDAINYGSLYMSGNIRIDTVEHGTFQNASFSGNNLQLNDELILEPNAYFSVDAELFQATNITARSRASLSLHGRAEINQLTVEKDATLSLGTYYYFNDGDDPTELDIGTADFHEGSRIQYALWGNSPKPGITNETASIQADQLNFVSSSSSHAMTRADLESIFELSDSYFSEYDYTFTSGAAGSEIRIYGTGIALADKADNPLPAGLTKYLDDYRGQRNLSGGLYNSSMEHIMSYLSYDWTRKRAAPEMRRYFNRSTTAMAAQTLQAGQQAQVDQVLNHMDGFRQSGGMASSKSSPAGAAGPVEVKKGWSGWIKGYGTKAEKDADADFAGYDANIAGAVIGVEKATGKSLFGLAGGTSRTDVNTDDAGSSDVDNWFGSLYSSFGAETWFLDATLSYGHNSVDANRGAMFASTASYNAHNGMLYLGGGRQYQTTKRLLLTPELGAQLNYYYQESFTESGVINNTYDAYDAWYFKSILGLNAAMIFPAGSSFSLRPELRAHWQHNFNADADRITYITEGTGTGGGAAIQSPEKDTLILGAGLVTAFKERLELDLRLMQQLSDGWKSTTVSGSLRYNF